MDQEAILSLTKMALSRAKMAVNFDLAAHYSEALGNYKKVFYPLPLSSRRKRITLFSTLAASSMS